MITEATVEQIRRRVESTVSPGRIRHIRAVVDLGDRLCRRFALDRTAGAAAAWAHDLAREWPHDALVEWALRDGEPLDEFQRANPVLLHGPAAAAVLRVDYGVDDESVLNAVRHHTLGRPGMGDLEMVIYVADYCEAGRPYLSEDLRAITEGSSLPAMVVAVARDARRRGYTLAPRTEAMLHEMIARDANSQSPTGRRSAAGVDAHA